jgi:signal transduction histidine kinase
VPRCKSSGKRLTSLPHNEALVLDPQSILSREIKHRRVGDEPSHPRQESEVEGVDAELAEIADQTLRACCAKSCFIGYRVSLDRGLVPVGLNLNLAQLLARRLEALFGREGFRRENDRESLVILSPGELVSLTGLCDEISLASWLIAARSSEQEIAVFVAVIVAGHRPQTATEAALLVASRAALLAVKARQAGKGCASWRERALAASEDLARHRQSILEEARERQRLDSALRALGRLPRRKRLQGFAETAALLSGSDAWQLAIDEGGGLTVRASFGLAGQLPLSSASALRASFERCAIIIKRAQTAPALLTGTNLAVSSTEDTPYAPLTRDVAKVKRPDGGRAVEFGRRTYAEDRVLREGGFAMYVALPFARGALLLVSSDVLPSIAIRRTRDFIAAAQPIVSAWLLEDEVERYRTLVQKLGLRLLSAADLERARIARDLHDDQAQFLATLKVALNVPKAKAKKLIGELECELRARIAALRPVSMGRLSLRRAIGRELERLEAAGVKTKLLTPVWERGLSKPMRQICFQVVREALANVTRHANAANVVVSLQRRKKVLWLEVVNDGVGAKRGKPAKGAGLTGLNERLALLGGSCHLTFGRGKTRLVAELPCVD